MQVLSARYAGDVVVLPRFSSGSASFYFEGFRFHALELQGVGSSGIRFTDLGIQITFTDRSPKPEAHSDSTQATLAGGLPATRPSRPERVLRLKKLFATCFKKVPHHRAQLQRSNHSGPAKENKTVKS